MKTKWVIAVQTQDYSILTAIIEKSNAKILEEQPDGDCRRVCFRTKREMLAVESRLDRVIEDRDHAPYRKENRFMEMSLDQLGVAVLEIAEAVNSRKLPGEIGRMSQRFAIDELRAIGANLRDLFTRPN